MRPQFFMCPLACPPSIVRNKDDLRLWIAKHYANRNDNLLCVAVVLEKTLVVKTLMHHFTWNPQS